MKQVLTLAGVAILASHIAYAEGQLNIYNWSDYIAEAKHSVTLYYGDVH